MIIFEHGKPKELLQFLKNFKKAIERMGMKTVAGFGIRQKNGFQVPY